MSNENYCIELELKAGGYMILSHNNRSSWKLKTAKKHLKDVLNDIEQNRPNMARFCNASLNLSDFVSL